jgi:hypothetical protein
MARKTNYAFDRNNRAKAKAAKREAKRQAKLAAKADKTGGTVEDEDPEGLSAEIETTENGQESHTDEPVSPGST